MLYKTRYDRLFWLLLFFLDRDHLHSSLHPLTDAGHVNSAEDIFEEYLLRVTAFEEKTDSCKKREQFIGH